MKHLTKKSHPMLLDSHACVTPRTRHTHCDAPTPPTFLTNEPSTQLAHTHAHTPPLHPARHLSADRLPCKQTHTPRTTHTPTPAPHAHQSNSFKNSCAKPMCFAFLNANARKNHMPPGPQLNRVQKCHYRTPLHERPDALLPPHTAASRVSHTRPPNSCTPALLKTNRSTPSSPYPP